MKWVILFLIVAGFFCGYKAAEELLHGSLLPSLEYAVAAFAGLAFGIELAVIVSSNSLRMSRGPDVSDGQDLDERGYQGGIHYGKPSTGATNTQL